MPITKPIGSDDTKSILIVDDDIMLLELLCESFKSHGLKVFKANNGIDGWCLFKSKRTDIVLTDFRMPGMDGAELSRRIRAESSNTKIAIITACSAEVGYRLVESGIADFCFKKPCALDNLCKTLIAGD